MCKVKQERDKINRHLRDVHGSTAPAPGHSFRGFLTFDDTDWKPLWLPKNENNPPAVNDMLVPIKNGRVKVYGIAYEVKDSSNLESVGFQNSLEGGSANVEYEREDETVDLHVEEKVENVSNVVEKMDAGHSSDSCGVIAPDAIITEVCTQTSTQVEADMLDSYVMVDLVKTKQPYLKVKTFEIEVEEGTFWSLEDHVDSDHEIGDSNEFSQIRLGLKEKRLVVLIKQTLSHKTKTSPTYVTNWKFPYKGFGPPPP